MLKKVMLVDDEPFILQGLSVIIDWEAAGYEIVKKADDGADALEYIRNNDVDLLITDIRMPGMSGIDLMEKIRSEKLSDCYIIILSGHNDFKYAQAAIHYSCTDYLLKPIRQDQLLETLERISEDTELVKKAELDNNLVRRGYLMQNLSALLQGKGDDANVTYVKENLKCGGRLRYIHISLNDFEAIGEMSDDEIDSVSTKLYEAALRFTATPDNIFKNFLMIEEEYEIGFLFCEAMAAERGLDSKAYLNALYKAIAIENDDVPFVFLVGKEVDSIARIAVSYSSACRLRSVRSFRKNEPILYYDDMNIEPVEIKLYSEELNNIVAAINVNDVDAINSHIDILYDVIRSHDPSDDTRNVNINYLTFRLLDLAAEQDESVNQSEILTFISNQIFTESSYADNKSMLKDFAAEYATYLIQLRKNVSGGILQDIENEIKEHFAEPLSLKDLGQKYYINSSYLGQIFRKRYGQSFKNYLNAYRVKEAASLLLKTDRKIIDIASDVGYHDLDYFISRFIEVYGCTPTRYRKSHRDQ